MSSTVSNLATTLAPADDVKDSLFFTFVSIASCCTGFFLFLTVLLAANNFIKAGTVGKMSVTFYALASFNGCMWTLYGVLLGSPTIALPNAWSVLTTTFALFSYFTVLGKEASTAKSMASNPQTPKATLGGVSAFPNTIVKIVNGAIVDSAAAGENTNNNNTDNTTNDHTAVEMTAVPTTTTTTSADGIVTTTSSTNSNSNNNAGGTLELRNTPPGSLNASPSSLASSVNATSTSAAVTVEAPSLANTPEDAAKVAEQLAVRLSEGKRILMVIEGINALFVAIIVLAYMFGAGATAISVSGTMGVVMATLLFTGPLDQVAWIVKNKNSSPLDPLMTVVGTMNACMWLLYGFLTNDFFVWSPNAVACCLCCMQLGLITIYPRVKVAA